jgi:hypothetical protein
MTGKAVKETREAAQKRQEELGPGKFGGFFEEEGLTNKLGSLSETLAESAIPTLAGIGTGLATRNPVAAGAVMLGGNVPMTYGGIRERQQAEGIYDVGRAARGTAVASALDILTGVGGKVLSGTAALAARELLEGGIRQATARVAKTGLEESATEVLQTVVEQVAGGTDPTTKQAMLETLEAGVVGAFGGTLFGGAAEAVSAPFRPRAGATSDQDAIIGTAVQDEFRRLASQEVATIMAADPNLSQDDAVNSVVERAEELATRARENVARRAEEEGGVDVGPEISAGMDVGAGGGAGVAPDLGAAPTAPSAQDLGETVGGGLGGAVPSVSVPAVGPGAGERPLSATQFDPITLPIYEAPKMADRKAVAKPIIASIIDTTLGDVVVPAKITNQIATQMAQRAARKEVFDPVELTMSVLAEQGIVAAPEVTAPEVAAPETVAPEGVAPTAVEEELAARDQEVSQEMLAPGLQTEPTVAEMATVEKVTPSSERTLNDLAGVGSVNPDNTNEVLVAGGGVQLTPIGEDIIQLDSLRAVEKGGGRKALTQLIEVADENGTTIQLNPEPFAAPAGKEMTPTELSDWYAGFGFEAQPDGTMIRPAATPTPATITPVAEFTPQQIVEQIDRFARSEAEDRGFNPGMFVEGARDAARGVDLLPDDLILDGQGQEALDAYKAGVQFGRERAADMQAAPTPTAPAEVTMVTAPETGGTEPLTDANVDEVLSVKLTKAQLKRLEQAAGIQRMKLSDMQKRIVRSRSAEETMSLAGKLMLMARNPDDSVNILTSLFNSVPPPVLQTLLAPLETGDVVRLGQRAGMENVTRIDDLMRDEYIPYVNRMMERASKLAEKWTDFTSRSPTGAEAMGDVMFYSNMINADPARAANVAEYLKIDQDYQMLSAQLAATKDSKKQRTLKGQLTRRRGEIQRLYFGATDESGGKVSGWNDVPPEGKQIFREARDYYRADFQEHYRLLMQRIDDAKFEEDDAARLKAAVDDMFKEAAKRVIYFPMKRFGDYWVSIGQGKGGEFHMFESASAQDAFIRRLRQEGETREIDFSKGKDTLRLGLRKKTEDASAALKGILDLIDGGEVKDVDILKDHVFQMYLTALPEADMRRRFVHRQFKTGFSTDTLRTFANTAIASAHQLGRLAYNYKFKNLIDQSYAETAGNPSKRRLDTITREIEMRVDTTLAAAPESGWAEAANLGAKATFLFILSSPKTAIMNLTQLHVVGLPTLSAEFGEKATYAMAARYTGQILTGQRIANPFRDEEGNVRLQIPNFTAEGSAYINGLRKTDPDRYQAILKAWDYGQEREVTESTFSSAASVYERSNEPSGELGFTQAVRQGAVGTAAMRATANAVNALGALFHHTERMGREVMYMSAFELAYDRNLAQGMTPAEAGDAAMVKATELTNKGMFDFSNWNKSRAAKAPLGKLALQMRSYSLSMTSLLFRSFANMVAFQRTKAERLAAARVFMGVGAITTIYAGFRSSQFYVLGMLGYGLYEFIKDTLAGDDEDEEVDQGYLTLETLDRELWKYADDKGRELSKKDMDYYVRSVWIPETFGAGGTMAEALGLSDGAAKKLETAADIGLPGVFGVDISNSVSLTSLWHPVDTKSDDPEVEFYEALGRIGLGPSGSLFVGAPMKFLKEANAGNLDKAIESITPMAIRGYVKAERLKDEGLVIGKNRDVVLKDPSFYDTYTLAMQSLGFPEAQTSRAMQMDIRAGEIEKEVADEKTKLLDQRYRAVLARANNPNEDTERELRAAERAIDIYNLNYPSNAITSDTKQKSFEQKQEEAAGKMYGLGVNPKIPVRQPLMERSAAEFIEEE